MERVGAPDKHKKTRIRNILPLITEYARGCREISWIFFFRMNIEQFYRLSQLVGEEIQKQNKNYRRAISPEERLAIFRVHAIKICRRQERDSRYYLSYAFS